MTSDVAASVVGPDKIIAHLIGTHQLNGQGAAIEDRNPARPDELIAVFCELDPADIDTAVTSARDAREAWARTPIADRAQVVRRAGRLLADQADEFATVLAREEGKPLIEARGEVIRAGEILSYFAEAAHRPVGEIFASPRAQEMTLVMRRPRGVIAAITPFNFPFAIPAWKIAPALVYGNPVLWKPSSEVPLCSALFADTLRRAGVPAGVINMMFGGAELGSALVTHPGVDAITFTGSTAVGRALIARCGALRKPIQTEMGGKNAVIVLADADLDLAAAQVVVGAFASAGQKCTSTSRLVVDRRVADDLLSLVQERMRALTLGDPLTPTTTVGPLINEASRDRAGLAIESALRGGHASLIYRTDGDEQPGWFLRPTLVEVNDSAGDLWQDELFAPVVTCLRTDTVADAFAAANRGEFGLAGSVFTRDLAHVFTAMDRFEVGTLHVNSETAGNDPFIPFGGLKGSGFGPREQGDAARDFFTVETSVYLRP
jgi:aldehyde dehydrogenase (NAD+)